VFGWRFFRTSIISADFIRRYHRLSVQVAFSLDGRSISSFEAGAGRLRGGMAGQRRHGIFVLILCLTWFSIGWQAIVILGGMSKYPHLRF
jgi:hypothetical protein